MKDFFVIKRMLEYLDFKGISRYKAEKLCGKSKNFLGITKNPTSEFVAKFLTIFPDLSAEWLFRGEGKMILAPSVSEIETVQEMSEYHCDTDSAIQKISETMSYLVKRCRELEIENDALKGEKAKGVA